MNRTSNRRHKPRISDQTLDSQESRCEDSKECSDESSEDDDDEDEDNSTDRDTEESEQESVGKSREWEALAKYLRSHRAYLERNPPDSFHGMLGARKETKDKMTQKNLASPMPSIWKPPVYKELSAAPNFKVIKSKEVKDKESEFEDVMLRYITKLQATNNAYKGEHKKPCPHKSAAAERIKKLCSKHKKQVEQHKAKRGRREDVHTCMDAAVSNAPERMKNEVGGGMKIHSRCGLPIRCYREHLKREPENENAGKLREKLVYVVEEEEGRVSKMETDLISVNEILAIKQDLLELSEFAKKLKRLKEIKSESEKEKSFETECQCKPLTELLSDVNKRMEALEARQEELERGIQKSREMETDTKKTDDTKTSSLPPLGPVKPEPSAVKSVSSFGRSEMSREGGGTFSKNLEIVNELLDIKSQLQKLERKRMSKELSPEIGPAGFPKAKPKDQTINVFSSKTYILTSDAYKKKKNNAEADLEERLPNSIPSMKEKTTICMEGQQANDIVADWLKNISAPENSKNNLKVRAGSNNVVEYESKEEESWRMRSFSKEKNRDRILEGKDFGNQEPQKNRAKDTERHEKNESVPNRSREIPSYSNRKEGQLISEEFSWRDKPRGRISRGDAAERCSAQPYLPGPNQSFVKPWKTVSSGSIPSVVAVKEQLRRVKHFGKTSNETNLVKPCRSKSAQVFTSASNLSKDEKMVLNMSRKNLEAKCARKREKENENEQVQGEMSRFVKLNREMFPNRSRLVATVNLDERSTSLKNDRSRSPDFPLPLFPFPMLPPEMFKILECSENEEKGKTDRENWCRRDDWDHKPKKEYKEKDKVKACIKKCYKQKTRIKCSRNHCCNKKQRRAASRSSPSCGSCASNKEAKKNRCMSHHKRPKKDCHSKKAKATCSCESVTSAEKKEEKERKKKEGKECKRKEGKECKKKEKPRHEKKKTCKQPCCSKKPEPPACETLKAKETDCQCQRKERLPTHRPSEEKRRHFKEKAKKSSLRYQMYCEPKQGRPFYDDSCYITSFWKNLRKLYPRFSALQLMSWLKLYCQEEKKTKQYQKDQKKETAECKPPKEPHKKYECPSCQCCKSYRMNTIRQEWPGVSPSSKIFENDKTEAETRSSVTTTETDFMFPYRKPKHYYAYKATQEEDEPEESKKSKKSKTRKKKEDKNNTTDSEGLENGKKKEDKNNTTDSEGPENEKQKCQCDRCGHIHSKKEKKKNKKKVNYEKSCCKEETEVETEMETEYEPESKARSKKSNKKGSKKSKKSIFSKLGDVRNLRVCEGKLKCPKLNFLYGKTDGESVSKASSRAKSLKNWYGSKKGRNCRCESKLLELEDRILNLEKFEKNKHKQKNTKEEQKNEDKEKKKKRKTKNDPESENAENDSSEGCHCEKKHKKREKKKSSKEDCHCEEKSEEKKKKKSKKDTEMEEESEKCECYPEKRKKKKKEKHKKSDSNDEEQVEIYYCDCMNKDIKTAEQSSAATGTETSKPAQTPSEKSSLRQNLQRKKKEVLEKLSSLTTFWKNFRGRKKSNETKTNGESALLDDSSRSSEVPVRKSIRAAEEEPSVIGKLRKQQKKDRKAKENRVQKSKSKGKRHRFG